MNGSGNFVDVLTAVATGPTSRNNDIFHAKIDFLGVNLGHNGDRGGGGLDSASFFGDGDTLNPMGAGLVFELVVGVIARNFDNMIINLTDFPTNFVGIADIHIHEIVGPNRSLLTTGSGIKFHDSNIGIESGHRLKK